MIPEEYMINNTLRWEKISIIPAYREKDENQTLTQTIEKPGKRKDKLKQYIKRVKLNKLENKMKKNIAKRKRNRFRKGRK